MKPLVVFVHGWCMNSTCLAGLEHVAKKLGFHTLNTDLPGHGTRRHSEGSFKLAIAMLKKKVGDRPCVVVGYSMGGMIAQQYAQKHPVQGIFLISTTHGEPHLTRNPYIFGVMMHSFMNFYKKRQNEAIFLKFLREVLPGDKRPGPELFNDSLYDFSKTRARSDFKLFYLGLERTRFDVAFDYGNDIFKHRLKSLKGKPPAHVVVGSMDPFTSVRQNKDIAKILSCECSVVKDATHLIVIQKRTEVERILKNWLANYKKNA